MCLILLFSSLVVHLDNIIIHSLCSCLIFSWKHFHLLGRVNRFNNNALVPTPIPHPSISLHWFIWNFYSCAPFILLRWILNVHRNIKTIWSSLPLSLSSTETESNNNHQQLLDVNDSHILNHLELEYHCEMIEYLAMCVGLQWKGEGEVDGNGEGW